MKGIMYENTYYSSIGTWREGAGEIEKKEGRRGEKIEQI